jgi:hypothetical protein
MPIVGGLDIHRKQITFNYLDTETGVVKRGQIAPADRAHLRAWLAQFAGQDDVAFALEGCTGWRYVSEELAWAVPHRSRQLHPPRPDYSLADLSQKQIKRRPVVGGLINEYERAA